MTLDKPFILTDSDILELCSAIDIDVNEKKITLGKVKCLRSIEETSEFSLSYLTSEETLAKYIDKIRGTVLLPTEAGKDLDPERILFDYIEVSDPKYLFAYVYDKFNKNLQENIRQMEGRRQIDSDSKISSSAVIDDGVHIGKKVEIESGVRIYNGTVIGDNVKVGANCVLGGVGFGFAVRNGYPPLRIPHYGSLQIGNNVEIGSGSHIDRGTFSTTTISDDVKIDNGVHIAHNVRIGRRTLVIAHAEISGSVEIGEDCWIAPNVSIKEKVKIGNNVLVGIGSVVLNDVGDNLVVAGIPARPLKKRN
jgi:UDP-3-O-[3-hydroxymyristoyl] glucosamine N-acyltransferase